MNSENATGVYLIISNLTKKIVISKDAKIAKSFFDQLFGLLNPSNPRTLIFQTHFGIHTFGLKIPIDILVLNQDLKVMKLKQSLPPNQLFFWNPKYSTIIELPNGTIIKSKVELNNQLTFKTP